MQPFRATQTNQSVSAAAEVLFETKNVTEIRQIEARTRREIEDKNLQLRQLVGDSYRDLIEGTDKIIDISTKCHSILGNILSIQESFGSLAVGVTRASGGQEGKDFVRKHQELHAVGSRVKYIMDTPEVIWGCLDAQQHLEAARRLLRVHEVHQHLQDAYSTDIAAKFPLMSHQWPLVLKFRDQVLDIASSTLSTKHQLTSQQAADATAAVAMLEGLGSAAALQRFLAGRKQWVQQQLEQALSGSNGQSRQEPGQVLADLAQQVQSCIAQVGELFSGNRPANSKLASVAEADGSSSLLQQVLHEDDADASDLYFGSMDAASEGSNSPEAVGWRQKSAAICQQLTPLQRSQVEQACSTWLADVAASCSQHGLKLLQLCSSAHSLLEAEQAVQQAMAEWTLRPPAAEQEAAAAAPDDVQASNDQEAAPSSKLGRSGSSGAALVAAAAGGKTSVGRGGAFGARAVSEWEVTCEAVLGEKLDLWQVLFHQPFLERCKAIIQAALQDACSSINEPLHTALQQAEAHEPEGAGQLVPGKWPSFISSGLADGVVLDRSYSFVAGRTSSGAWSSGPQSLAYSASGMLVGMVSSQTTAADGESNEFRNEVVSIKQLFDRRLHSALQAVLLLTAATGEFGASSAASPRKPGSSAALGSLAASGRAGSLQPFSSHTSSFAAQAAAAPNGTTAVAAAAAACAAAGKYRAAELEQFAQQQCVELVQQLAGRLQQQLQQLPQLQDGIHGASAVEQVLLISRLCHAIATSSTMLPALLGAPDGWLAASKAGPDAAAGGAAGASGSSNNSLPASLAQGVSSLGPAAAALLRMHHPSLMGQPSNAASAAAAAQLAAIQQQLHSIACSGYATWAGWVSSSLFAALLAALKNDELLHSTTTPLSWVDTRVAAEGGDAAAAALLDPLDDAAAAGEMRFALPACPSAAVLQMLSLACWETRRAGEHLISTDALQLLQWELHGAALNVLQQLCASSSAAAGAGSLDGSSAAGAASETNSGSGVSEKGVLQLLFDQRLLRDVLGGGKPLGATAAAVVGAAPAVLTGGEAAAAANGLAGGGTVAPAAALAARKKLVAAVEQELQDQLDPIDWATYEPHLWANVQRYYQRTSVLLGTLGQLQKPYTDTPRTAGTASADFNTLNLLPVVPRFHYLPISTPTALHSSAAAKQRLSHTPGGLAVGPLGLGVGVGSAGAAGAVGAAAGAAAGVAGLSGQLPLASTSSHASDLAAQYIISDLGSGGMVNRSQAARPGPQGDAAGASGTSLHLSADAAAAAGASALSAIQARLQGSSFGAFGSMLGDRAAEIGSMAQSVNFGDLLPSAGLGGGLLSSFARREGNPPVAGSRK